MFLEDKDQELKPVKFMGLIQNHINSEKINSEDFVYIYGRFIEVINKIIEINDREDKRSEVLQK